MVITRSMKQRVLRNERKKPNRYDPFSYTAPSDIQRLIQRLIHEIVELKNAKNYSKGYIGKTATKRGMQQRYNHKYKYLGINNITKLYETNDESFAYLLERKLIEHCRHRDVFNCLNEGLYKGPSSRNGPYIVYLAHD